MGHDDLLYWLNTRSSGDTLYVADDANAETVLYTVMAFHANLIYFDGVIGGHMRYQWTNKLKKILADTPFRKDSTPANATPQTDSGARGIMLWDASLQADIMEYFSQCDRNWHDGKRTAQMVYEGVMEFADYEVLFSEVDTALGRLFLDGKLETIHRDDATWYRATAHDTPAPVASERGNGDSLHLAILECLGHYITGASIGDVRDWLMTESTLEPFDTRFLVVQDYLHKLADDNLIWREKSFDNRWLFSRKLTEPAPVASERGSGDGEYISIRLDVYKHLTSEKTRLQGELESANAKVLLLEDQLRQCNEAYYNHT
jgi:hypothetical protein